ncbi:hypothetical protein AYI68_g116 [Smittium mucronatum]|uniref:Transcription factor domain-containing protein n=1 Tax=Smittium mucronatum TaxID=133383 RepID=A0A1R0H996_9FUNG|nr:hypothetical protein AYI68_g116 [Smittium mucronatum]
MSIKSRMMPVHSPISCDSSSTYVDNIFTNIKRKPSKDTLFESDLSNGLKAHLETAPERLNFNSHQHQYEHALPVPSYMQLKEILFFLLTAHNHSMFPVRVPDFLYRLKHKKFPKYFFYAFLAAGIDCIDQIPFSNYPELSSSYAKAALRCIRNAECIYDPYIIWASVLIFVHHYKSSDIKEYFEISNLSRIFYKMDQHEFSDCLDDPIELEFKRRVWWSYYIIGVDTYVVGSGFPSFDLKDIVVKLPKNDFEYRYGGCYIDSDPDLINLVKLANTHVGQVLYPDEIFSIIKVKVFFGNLSKFIKNRWLSINSNQNTANLKFVKYSNRLKEIKIYIDEKYNIKLLMGGIRSPSCADKFSNFQEAQRIITIYFFNQIYTIMVLLLYQSELVRINFAKMNPNRIKSAKSNCIKASLESYILFKWESENIPFEPSYSLFAIWKVFVSLMLLNCKFIQDDDPMADNSSLFDKMLNEIKNSGKKSTAIQYAYIIISKILIFKEINYPKNLSYKQYLDLMVPYSLSENDIQPWVIPKYLTFHKFECCTQSNYSTLNVKEYLFLSSDSSENRKSRISYLINS